ncbi:hypothetical protein CERSUDRAFT_96749 [Gelatoporia subvermispora B]|uniref:receptor protein-tyrosine kinase n=1 Tax=Ceriporiopsis subvermispora (strain B) TaxID=914234 RepID=M2RA28_CERS8|nr:hypothetical protein CERSUDRAFT_96749 [Gelatoporia subvermispora B]
MVLPGIHLLRSKKTKFFVISGSDPAAHMCIGRRLTTPGPHNNEPGALHSSGNGGHNSVPDPDSDSDSDIHDDHGDQDDATGSTNSGDKGDDQGSKTSGKPGNMPFLGSGPNAGGPNAGGSHMATTSGPNSKSDSNNMSSGGSGGNAGGPTTGSPNVDGAGGNGGGSNNGSGSSSPSSNDEDGGDGGSSNNNNNSGNSNSNTNGGGSNPQTNPAPSGNSTSPDAGSPHSSPSADCTFVNENDGRLQYSGAWTLQSTSPNGLHGTTHSTVITGSSVVINWNGTSIIVVGIVPPSNATVGPPFASYTIDDTPPIELSLPIAQHSIPNQQFFQSPEFPAGTHTLTINVTTSGNVYTLDYLFFCDEQERVKDTPQPASGKSTRLSRRDTMIIAGVVGGVFLLLFLAFGLLWYRRRRMLSRRERISTSPVKDWLFRTRSTLFTSSESIIRNNPTHTSSAGTRKRFTQVTQASDAPSRVVSAPPRALTLPSHPLPLIPDDMPPSINNYELPPRQSHPI